MNSNIDLKLVYSVPPDNIDSYDAWEKYGLAMGNGTIGGSVLGGVFKERINLNEKSLWSGGPSKLRPNYLGGNIVENGQYGKRIKQVQKLFSEGEVQQALSLCDTYLVGAKEGYGYYLNYGNMLFDFDYNNDNYSNYLKSLDLRTGIITVEYDVDGVHYVRESFTSYPDNVIVTNIKSIGGKLGFILSVLPDNKRGSDTVNGNNNSDYTRTWDIIVKNDILSVLGSLDDNGLVFSSHSKVITDGVLIDDNDTITVKSATQATVITSIGTDYKNSYPTYRTGETPAEVYSRVLGYVTNASDSYSSLKQTHINDYSGIFGRVDLELTDIVPKKTTDEIINAYRNGEATVSEKRYLETLMFQFGRYLSIEGSRKAPEYDPSRLALPTNLQGMWVGANNSCWHSDYHININLQMNYWPAYVTNMVETAEPLINYVDCLREPGRLTASVYTGITSTDKNPENGFMAHTQNTPYGWTCPGYSFSWGWSTSAVAWLLQNCWEHYEYTCDLDYLKNNIYPIMKEASIFFDQYLIEDAEGYLVSSPAYSPEHGPYTEGNTFEHTLIWQLYENTVTAANLLKIDYDKVTKWKENQSRLKGPIEIGADGQIKEWYEETTLGSVAKFQNGHRHLSNLIGLFPGNYINTETPELLEAAKTSLTERGDATTGWKSATGWSMSWRALCWARLGNGEKAYDLLDYAVDKTYPNLYQTYPPFQIDGVYGYTAAVAEMLIQSNMGYINLLPAISQNWKDGSVSGLLGRGNFEISVKWRDNKLVKATIKSNNGGVVKIQSKNISLFSVNDSRENIVEFSIINSNRISFETKVGEIYILKK